MSESVGRSTVKNAQEDICTSCDPIDCYELSMVFVLDSTQKMLTRFVAFGCHATGVSGHYALQFKLFPPNSMCILSIAGCLSLPEMRTSWCDHVMLKNVNVNLSPFGHAIATTVVELQHIPCPSDVQSHSLRSVHLIAAPPTPSHPLSTQGIIRDNP